MQQSIFGQLPSNRGVRLEVKHWRHEELSARRRLWGFDLPVLDIDWLHLNYDYSEPVALIEWTLRNYRSSAEAGIVALKRLGDRAGLPVFLVFYKKMRFESYRVEGLNDEAVKWLGQQEKIFSEKEFVGLLYRLQGRKTPKDIEDILASGNPSI